MSDRKIITLENSGHTFGCLLRPYLFRSGATFAACNVHHPQDTSLQITVHAEDATACLMTALKTAIRDVDELSMSVTSQIE